MTQIRLKVKGMSCGHCVAAVENGLKSVPGVAGVSVDLDSGLAVVEGDVSAQDLVEAVVEEGYEANIEN